MKVLGLIDHMGLGGAQQVFCDLREHLDLHGIDFRAISLKSPATSRVPALTSSERYGSLDLVNPMHALRVKKSIREVAPDVVNAHLYVAPLAELMLPRSASTPPTVVTVHTHAGAVPRTVFRLFRLFAVRGAHFVAIFPNAVPDLLALGISSTRITVSGLGVHIPEADGQHHDLRRAFRETYGIPEDAFVISSFSRLHSQRRLMEIVEAFGTIAARVQHARLVFAGSGSERARLEDRIDSLGLGGRVVFTGRLSSPVAFAAASDVAYSISVDDELGVAALQMVGLGVPCVALNIRGSERAWRPEAPLLQVANVAGLARALEGMARGEVDLKDVSEVGRLWVKTQFSVDNVLRAHALAYRHALEGQ